MKTARDLYPETHDEVFEKASEWVCENYSYVPYMEPARDGFIAGYERAIKEYQEETLEIDAWAEHFKKQKKLRPQKTFECEGCGGQELRDGSVNHDSDCPRVPANA